MKTITTSIILKANSEQVWNVLLDFGQYANWNPFIQKIKGKAELGAQLENSIHLPGKDAQVFKPEVIMLKKNQHFAWRGMLFIKGLFDGEHHFRLIALPDGNTKLIHEEFFAGLLVKPILKMVGEQTLQGFEAMNEALAKRLGTLYQATTP